MALILAVLFGFIFGVFGNNKHEATRVTGFDIPMQIMANILKNNDVSQFNQIMNKETVEETQIPIKSFNKENDNAIVRNVDRKKQMNKSSAPARELVFEILSDDARVKAMEAMSKTFGNSVGQHHNVQHHNIPKIVDNFDSISFLLNSGFTTKHFERLFSRVKRGILVTLLDYNLEGVPQKITPCFGGL